MCACVLVRACMRACVCNMYTVALNSLWLQYNTIQYNTIQYNTIQYNTIQYNTIQYNNSWYISLLGQLYIGLYHD